MSSRTETPPFTTEPVTVRAPATSANLGPGFDSFGLALARYDTVTATAVGHGLTVDLTGEGAGELPLDERHLVVRALRATLDVLALPQPALRLLCRNTIPQARGLGSSSAAIVSGIRLAEGLAAPAALRPGHDLELATALEGHADNVAACLRGGFTIAWTTQDLTSGATGTPQDLTSGATFDSAGQIFDRAAAGRAATGAAGQSGSEAVRLDVHPDVRPVLFIPPVPLRTSVARACLPAHVVHGDASATAARAGLLTAALMAYPELLLPATEDRLHQEHRRSAMPQSLDLVDRLRGSGFAAVLSGAGPSVLVLATVAQLGGLTGWCPSDWTTLQVPIDERGAVRRKESNGSSHESSE